MAASGSRGSPRGSRGLREKLGAGGGGPPSGGGLCPVLRVVPGQVARMLTDRDATAPAEASGSAGWNGAMGLVRPLGFGGGFG